MALHPAHIKEVKLKRSLTLLDTTVAGVGIILGAGIYALIGVASGYAGNTLWLSFVLAAIMAIFTGLSYAELSSIYKSDSTEYEYTRKAFNKTIGIIIGVLVIFSGIFAASTVSIGFGNYLNAMTGLPILWIALSLIAVLSLINFIGIKFSMTITWISTIIEFVGLIIIIILGIKYFGSTDLLAFDEGLGGVLKATALVFFAFIGFESIVKLAEETKEPRKTIPKALILSILITTVVYVLVAVSAVSVLSYEKLSISKAPLAEVAAFSLGSTAFLVLAVIALFSTLNTVLLSLVTSSRLAYGLGKQKALPEKFGEVNKKTRTPWLAILIIGIISIIFAFFENIEVVANITNISIFLTFAFVNLSLLFLRYKEKPERFKFRVKFMSIGRFSVIAFLGFLTSSIMLVYTIINLISA